MTVASTRSPVVLWAGPINASQAPTATLRGAKRQFFPCTGDGSTPPKCSSLAVTSGGRMLPGLLAKAGLTEEQAGDIYLGAFSAGGHLWKRLLSIPEDRARVRGVMLHDAAYEVGSAKAPAFVEGFVQYGVDVLKDPNKFLLMTASTTPNVPRPGEVYQSGADTMRATIEEIGRRSGKVIEEGGTLPASVPPASKLWRPKNNAIFAQYNTIGHQGLAMNAGVYWQHVLEPWVESPKESSASESNLIAAVVAFSVGVAAGYTGARYLRA